MIIYFVKAVNMLTPQCKAGKYVTYHFKRGQLLLKIIIL